MFLARSMIFFAKAFRAQPRVDHQVQTLFLADPNRKRMQVVDIGLAQDRTWENFKAAAFAP